MWCIVVFLYDVCDVLCCMCVMMMMCKYFYDILFVFVFYLCY